jgi:uncharacterized OsmC-like protein
VATRYDVDARSTDVFGRVLCSTREHHFVIDGPVQNGCPGEEVTPAEAFLSGVAACAVELIQVFAREAGLPLRSVRAAIEGELDRDNPVRRDVTVFNSVRLQVQLEGVERDEAERLVERFKGR